MGWRIAEEVQEYAPASLTWRELYVACVLANTASEHTRVCRPGLLTDEQLMRRLRLTDKREILRVIEKLIDSKVIERVTSGRKGVQAEFRFLPLAPAQGGESTHPSGVQGGETAHPEPSSGWGFSPLRVGDSSAQGGDFTHPSQESQRDQSLSSSADGPVGAPAASRERRGSTNNDTPAQPVLDAYAAALGRPVPKSTQTKILDHAQRLIADGYPAPWLADRAREMAPKGWTDLERHAARSTVPLPGASRAAASGLPEWCGECGVDSAGAAKFNPRLRVIYDGNRPIHCHKCHPIMIERSA
jgi:hypothetical protein